MTEEQIQTNRILAQQIAYSKMKYVVIHYTATNVDWTGEQVKAYDISVGNGIPYHIYLNADGRIDTLQADFNRYVGGMSFGYGVNNEWCYNSWHICFETLSNLAFNELQEEIMIDLFKQVILLKPGALIGGHREFPDLSPRGNKGRQNTLCPGAQLPDVSYWLQMKGIAKENCFYEVWK